MAFRYLPRFRSIFRVLSLRRVLRWGLLLLFVLVVMDVGYLVGIWPQWESYREGPIQRSNFIRGYQSERERHPDWPDLRWNPVPIKSISKAMIRAVIAAEDKILAHVVPVMDPSESACYIYSISCREMV
jgi:membrane peptidoglycan carboxypeptidase